MRFHSSSLSPACSLLLGLLLLHPAATAAETNTPARRLSLNSGWTFSKGDPAGTTAKLDYAAVKEWLAPVGAELLNFKATPAARPAAEPPGEIPAAQPSFDDASWRKLDLPHDWGIEGPFAQENPGDTGKLPWWGVAWYRKHLDLPAADAGKRIYLDIDGAMSYSMVWLNGRLVGGWPYGYSSYRIDLTPFVKPGADNVLAIRLDNLKDSSRWYPGGGIYRNVWLVKTEPVRFSHWGVFVTTPKVNQVSATTDVSVELDNATDAPVDARVTCSIYELSPEGRRADSPVAVGAPIQVRIAARRSARSSLTAEVGTPFVWSPSRPFLYRAVTTLEQGGRVVDTNETVFGIRTIAWDASRGFLLNGEVFKLQGVCNHHDLGALGSAINTRALERQLEILRSMGCNAIRTSHNPPAPELLDLCDRLGFVVMDEAFDCWLKGKKPADYSLVFTDWHQKDLRALVRRDRNHPSVILWSIGNEIREQGEPEGYKLATHLAGIVREEDRSRAVCAGFNDLGSGYNGFHKAVDVVGYNYKPWEYGAFHKRNPAIPLVGSETSSCVSSRGEYFFPVSEDKARGRADFQVSSYDLYAPPWAFPPDAEFLGLDRFPFTAGEFVWTGFDYLGEPTPYNADTTNLLNFSTPADQARVQKELTELGKIRVPSRSSYFGIIDLAGFPKDRFYIYQARWRPDLPMAHILPHWTWPGREGQVTPVHVYTSGDEAELFLNGRSLGRRKLAPLQYRLRWDEVVYEPGELRVVAYKKGALWAEDKVRTAGPAASLALSPDRATILADGGDLSFVTVKIADKAGLTVPRAMNRVSFELNGPGEIIAVDNGDATSFESFQAKERKAYNGLALVVIRSLAGKSGKLLLKARSEGLAPSEIALESVPPPAAPAPRSARAGLPTLFLIGDSTGHNEAPGLLGWGDVLPEFVDASKYNLVNRARPGRSSRSFLNEGLWALTLAELKAGDTVLIQFGHNDQGPLDQGRARGTLPSLGEETREVPMPGGALETVHSFGWYLRSYIADIRAKGARPVLLSPTVRNAWKAARVERGSAPQAALTAQLAVSEGVPFIDLSKLAADRYDELGLEKTAALFANPGDQTHTGPAGARLNASLVATALKPLL